MKPGVIFYGSLLLSWFEYLWDSYLDSRQRKVLRKNVAAPKELSGIVTDETFTKARLYSLDKSNFGLVQGVFKQILDTVVMWFLGYKLCWDAAVTLNEKLGIDSTSEILNTLSFLLIMDVFQTIINLPFKVYSTFVVEQKHGFNKQTTSFFVKDTIKQFIVTQLVVMPITAGLVKIVYWGGDYFVVYLYCFIVVCTLFMMTIYPEVIAPLFDKYTPIPTGDLRTKIEQLAAEVGFPLYKLYVVEGSKRSSHSNAYFYGFFRFKRIVLYDTLLEKSEREKLAIESDKEEKPDPVQDGETKEAEDKEPKGCNTEEILAVLGHELGHWKMNHTLKNLIMAQLQMVALLSVFGYLYKNQAIYSGFGFHDTQPVLIGLIIVMQFVMAPFNHVLSFVVILMSRRFEFQADRFAAETLGRGEMLASSLVKLNNDNLSFPIYDWLYSSFNHSHPTLLQRLETLKKIKESRKKKE